MKMFETFFRLAFEFVEVDLEFFFGYGLLVLGLGLIVFGGVVCFEFLEGVLEFVFEG